MTPRERLLAVLNGKTPDKVPFAPFSELLPRGAFERELRNRGMGLVHHHTSVVNSLKDITEIRKNIDGKSITIYQTPVGEVSTSFVFKHGVSNDGSVQSEYMIKAVEDYAATIAYLDATVFDVDTYDNTYLTDIIGDDGILHTWSFEPPYMGAQYYLGFEKWIYDQQDYSDSFKALLDALERMQERRMSCVIKAPEDIVNIANLAGNFSPDAFERDMLPYCRKYASLLSAHGIKTTLHADASNMNMFKYLVPKTGINIVEAFTPPPVGDLSLAEARRCWGDAITIWINFPESVFYEGYEQTKQYTIELLRSDPCPNKLISFTEMGLMGVSPAISGIYKTGILAIMDAIDEAGTY